MSGGISGTTGRAGNWNKLGGAKLGGAIGVVAGQLWHALQSTDADGAKVIVEQLGVSFMCLVYDIVLKLIVTLKFVFRMLGWDMLNNNIIEWVILQSRTQNV